MRMEELRENALDLHSRRISFELDAGGVGSADELAHFALELGVGGGGVEVGQEVRHSASGRQEG